MTRFANILETVGNTPVVKINKLAPDGVNLYVKVEAFNPLGSVKDRLALGVIEDAERSGALKPGQTVIEATSGNTGIGLAMVCAAKGYPLVVTMAETFSVERRKLMRFLGAKVVLTPAPRARHRHGATRPSSSPKKNGWFLTRQFENEANADFHSRTTAREIIDDFAGRAARLLGHRLRHRRDAQGRGPRARQGTSGDEDRRLRTGRRADGHERHEAAAQRATARRRRAIRRGSRIRFRAGARTSSRSSPAMRSTRSYVDRVITVPAPEAMQCEQASSRGRKGFSSASRLARRSPRR